MKLQRLQPKQRNLLRLRQFRSVVPVLHASLFQRIFRVKSSPTFPRIAAAPIAAVRYASLVKMSPSNWSVSRQPIK
jgi:hypothetical protein